MNDNYRYYSGLALPGCPVAVNRDLSVLTVETGGFRVYTKTYNKDSASTNLKDWTYNYIAFR